MTKDNGNEEKRELIENPETLPAEQIPVGGTELVSDEDLVGAFDEILDNIRNDRNQISTFVDEFAHMVINDGDSSTSSKEAFVNLVKLQLESADKMAKIAELKTRVKLKQPYGDTVRIPQQGNGKNVINIYDQGGMNKRALIDAISKAKKGE